MESAFYITVWAITAGNKMSNGQYAQSPENGYQIKNVVLLVGYLSLVISAVIHIFLALLRSYRKVEVFSRIRQIRDVTFDAVRRRLSKTPNPQLPAGVNPASFVDISSFSKSPVRGDMIAPQPQSRDSSKFSDNGTSNSYFDFKDRIDDHVCIESKERSYNSRTNKQIDSNPVGEENSDSSTKSSFTAETETAEEYRTNIRSAGETAVVKDETTPNNSSPTSSTTIDEITGKSSPTQKRVGAIRRLLEKYSKISSKLSDRFKNFSTAPHVTNEKQKTPSSNLAEKDLPETRSEETIETVAQDPSEAESLKKPPGNPPKQSSDVGKVKQTCQRIKKVTQKFSLSPEASRATRRKENVGNFSDAQEKAQPTRNRARFPVAPKLLNDHIKNIKPQCDQSRRNNRGIQDEEDDIFVKVPVPKILVTPDQCSTVDKILPRIEVCTERDKETKVVMSLNYKPKRENDGKPPPEDNQ